MMLTSVSDGLSPLNPSEEFEVDRWNVVYAYVDCVFRRLRSGVMVVAGEGGCRKVQLQTLKSVYCRV